MEFLKGLNFPRQLLVHPRTRRWNRGLFTTFDRAYCFTPIRLRNMLDELSAFFVRGRMRTFYAQFIHTGDLVFDIGACTGEETRIFLDLGAQVICLDPQPACVSILTRKFARDERVTIVPKGVGETSRVLEFHVSSNNRTTSTFSAKFMQHSRYACRTWDRTIQAPVVTLDALIQQYGLAQYIKIDTEGFELPALKGLHSKIPCLSFEFNIEFLEDCRQCIRYLHEMGWTEFNYSLFKSYTLASKTWGSAWWLEERLQASQNPFLCGDIYCRNSAAS